jgi:hypothetical protein
MSGLPFVIRAGDSSHEGILENNALLERRCPVFVSVSDREIASPCRGGNEKRKRKRLTLLRRLQRRSSPLLLTRRRLHALSDHTFRYPTRPQLVYTAALSAGGRLGEGLEG